MRRRVREAIRRVPVGVVDGARAGAGAMAHDGLWLLPAADRWVFSCCRDGSRSMEGEQEEATISVMIGRHQSLFYSR